MGFDNECILNIQSLAGEYFCPVCRLLVYPNEALQSQCTHLYCKPCLTYVVSTTHACPYDGYLVTEADSKPLVESNKALAETIDKIAVHCLYHRSGCTWQGSLSECTSHCATCAFGNSPVVCNRCGTQIVHRQVQEHAQSCPGVQPQAQQAEGAQDATAAAVDPNQTAIQTGTPASQAQSTQVATTAPSTGNDQNQASTSTQPQAAAIATPTPEQWYQQQQQYQQYYQQYPGYDPYQQQYQAYNPYQHQAPQQYQQQHVQTQPAQLVQGQHQPQVYMQPQPTQQPPARPPHQILPQSQPQANSQVPIGTQAQMQVPVNPQQQPPQMQLQSHPPSQSNQYPQLYPQGQSQPPQYHAQPHVQTPMQQRPQMPHQQSLAQVHHAQPHHLPGPPQPHPHPQAQPHPHPQLQQQPHMHPQPQPQVPVQPQSQPQSQNRAQPHPHLPAQQPTASAVTGHQSYPHSQAQHQMLSAAPQQHPLQMHPQQGAAAQAPQMRPPQSHVQMQHQQVPSMPLPPQGQHLHAQQPGQPAQPHHGVNLPQQQIHGHLSQAQPFPGQTAGLVQNHSQQPAAFMQQQQPMQSQPRPHGPPASMLQPGHANPLLQQNASMPYGMPQPHQSQNHVGRPVMSNHGPSHQPFQQSSGPNKLMQPSGTQPSTANQNYHMKTNSRPQSSEQQGPLSVSTGPQSGANGQLSSVQVKHEQQDGGAPQLADENIAGSSQGADATDRVPKLNEEKSVNEIEGRSVEPNLAVKDVLEEPVAKQMVKDDAAVTAEPSAAEQEGDPHSSPSHIGNSLKEDKETENAQIQKSPVSKNAEILEGTDLKSKKDTSDSQMTGTGSVAGDKDSDCAIQASEMNSLPPPPFNRDPSQQPFRQTLVPTNDRMLPQPAYHERNFPPMHYRPPHMQDLAQRPPQNQMQMLGQPPSQMRPQMHNSLGAPDLFRPPVSKQPHAFHPGAPAGVFPGPGSSSFGRGPGFLGPQRSFDSQSAANQGHLPPPYGSEGHHGHPHVGNHVDTEYGNKRPGYFDGRLPDSLLPGSAERFGLPGSNNLKIGGVAGKDLAGGVHDPSFPYGLQEDRFKSFPEERFKRLAEEGFNRIPEEHFKSFSMESTRRNRREFEEDLKQFPVPGHLDGEGVPKFDNYFSSSRPLDRGPHDLDRAPHGFNNDIGLKLDGGPSVAGSRLLPAYHPGGSSLHSMRPIGFHDDNMCRQKDSTALHSDFLRRAPDSGPHLPPTRSPGREYLRFGPGNQSRLEDIDGRESRLFGERSKPFNLPPDGSGFLDSRFPGLPGHLRRGEPDGHLPLHLRSGDFVGPDILPSHLRGIEPTGSRNFPSHMRMGEPAGFGSFPNHLRMGEPRNMPLNLHNGEAIGGNLASHARVGEPGFSSSFPYHGNTTDGVFFNAGDVEPLDQSRKRKHRSMGWCRICKVDCETVEGLELHSQTREHQKMAMDMVLSIKKDNAKKQKASSDNHIPQDDANKSRKATRES